jgi:predicted PhzF superfamily epimerase YddE/YHI9
MGRQIVMQFDKSTIVQFLQQKGEGDKAQQAQQQLPDTVDHEQHADLLQRLGINPQDLMKQLGGDFLKKL